MSRRKQKWKAGKSLESTFHGEMGIVESMRKEKAELVMNTSKSKLSEAILKILFPFLKKYPDRIRVLVQLAIIAWNSSIISDVSGQKAEQELYAMLEPATSNPESVKSFVQDLMTRKRVYFPDDKRIIVDFELIEDGDSITLNVAGSEDNVE